MPSNSSWADEESDTVAARNLLLTGPSGVGKSTVLQAVARSLTGRVVRGFVSQSIRNAGQLIGWRLDSFTGRGGVFMHCDLKTPHRLGRYGVDLSLLERLVETEFDAVNVADLYVIDEIGRAGPMSALFVSTVTRLLDSGAPTVSAVHRTASGFPQTVRERTDVDLWEVTRENRDKLVAAVLDWGGWSPPNN